MALSNQVVLNKYHAYLKYNQSYLMLDSSGNNMTGTLPSQIGMLTNLVVSMTGTLPSELGLLNMLQWLTLEENVNFSGLISSQFGQLTDLMFLTLSSNDLAGSIPSELGLLTLLGQMMLGSTHVTGTVPETLFKIFFNVVVDCCFVEECTCCNCDRSYDPNLTTG
jgi:hypothetical protein